MANSDLQTVISNCLSAEAKAIQNSIPIVVEQIEKASHLINACTGVIVVTGVGKSALIGQKIAAAFRSISVRSTFLNAQEFFHGDSGFLGPEDVLLAISNSGKTREFSEAIDFAKRAGSKVIAMVGKPSFPRASLADLIISATVSEEAHEGNFLPTASTTLSLACGDALVVSLAELNHFNQNDFIKFHPSGSLGVETSLKVTDVMIEKDSIATVYTEDSLRDVAEQMTAKPHGMALVLDSHSTFFGVVTDGDIRRALLESLNADDVKARDLATRDPLRLDPKTSVREAVRSLEDKKPHPVYSAPVMDGNQILGIVTLHLLVQIGTK